MNIKKFKASDWIQIWAGHWSLLTCSYYAKSYTKNYIIAGKVFLDKTILLFDLGKSSCFAMQSYKEEFSKNLANEVAKNPERIFEILKDFRHRTDEILSFISKNEDKEITKDIWRGFWEAQDAYYIPHINTKYVTDGLPKETLEKILPDLESARVNAEPVFKKTEEFIAEAANQMGKKYGYPKDLMLSLMKEEFEGCFEGKKIPSKEELEKRFKRSALLFEKGKRILAVGDEVKEVEVIVFAEHKGEIIKGMPAYAGKVQGIARIILDPKIPGNFKKGDILVTGMTRPEYMLLMESAAAIVTDAGGILSHAAITARELKKPCVIGTKMATKILKDGDLVEVDANNGIVRIIK